MRKSRASIADLLREALTSEWQPEMLIVAYVRQHRAAEDRDLRAHLRELQRIGEAESQQNQGYKGKHWRRVAAKKAA